MNNIKDQNKINWINIIFNKEFLNYIDIQTVKELSLVSKLVRKKLESILFKNIVLAEYKLKLYPNPFNSYFDYLLSLALGVNIKDDTSKLEIAISIDQWISSISTKLSAYKTIANKFSLAGVEKVGYYMLPILNIFDNLKFLRLECCSIPFMVFSNLSEPLLSLETMELVYVTFVKSSSDIISNGQFNFPQNLRSLKIYNCEVSVESVLNPEEFLFSDDELTAATNFLLPEYSMPSLKELGIFGSYGRDSGINQFIELNPNLESLIIKSYSLSYTALNLIKCSTNLKSLDLHGSVNLNPETQIPTLESINKLSFDDFTLDKFEIVKKLSLSCPNLTSLNFKMVAHKNFQNTIDSHIAQILNYLPKLKYFSLYIIGNIFEKMNFSALYWLETLVVESGQLTILNIDFESCRSLRKVAFKSFPEINTTEFKNKFSSIIGWKFKYSSSIIKGCKLL